MEVSEEPVPNTLKVQDEEEEEKYVDEEISDPEPAEEEQSPNQVKENWTKAMEPEEDTSVGITDDSPEISSKLAIVNSHKIEEDKVDVQDL